MSNKKIVIILSLLMAHSHFANASDGFLWRPSSISLSIGQFPKILKEGQHLHLVNRLQEGESGWTDIKIDLPDTWNIQSLEFSGDSITFQNQLGDFFSIKPPILNILNFEILDGGRKTDKLLEKIWKKHALKKANIPGVGGPDKITGVPRANAPQAHCP